VAQLGGGMKSILLVIAAWTVTVLIGVLGVNAGATIWFYREPVMESVAEPASYFVAAYSGIVALILSFVVSLGISIHVAYCRAKAASA